MTDDAGNLLPLNCRCTDEFADAVCPDHGVLAFLRSAQAFEDERTANEQGDQE
jgi:hypothetical protein